MRIKDTTITNEVNMKIKNTIITTTAALAAVTILWNSFIVVQDGTVETQSFLGKVSPEVYSSGLHIVNPLSSFTVYSVRDIKLSFDGIAVPSQDKFKTSVDLSVMVKFDGTKAPSNKINGGANQEAAIDKYVTTKLMSTVREFGKSIPIAQDLFKADVQSSLQTSIMNEVNEYSRVYGYTITDVFIQDVELDEVIKKQITNTKEREEKVYQAKADRARDNEIAQKTVDAATANRKAADENAQAAERNAIAVNFAAKQETDAKLYAAQKEAEANTLLQRTITPEMIKWRQLEVEQTRANKYLGGVPNTVIGGDYQGGLLMDIRK